MNPMNSSKILKKEELTTRVEAISYFEGEIVNKFNDISEEISHQDETFLLSKFNPTTNDFLLRKRISKLITEAKKNGKTDKFTTKEIYDGIISKVNFYTKTLNNPYKLAWIFLPVHDYSDLIEDSFFQALIKIRTEVLTMPVTEKTASVILKAYELLANRTLGPVVQRIEQKNMNLNLSQNAQDLANLDPEAMLEKYNQVKAKLSAQAVKQVKTIVEDEEEVISEEEEIIDVKK